MFLKKQKGLVAVDIGSNSIKLTELKRIANGFRLLKFAVAPLPADIIVDKSLISSITIVETIKNLISSEKISTNEVALSLSPYFVFVKKLYLPMKYKDNLYKVIFDEVEPIIPFDINNANIYAKISKLDSPRADSMEVKAFVVKREIVDEYTNLILEAGLRPAIVDIDNYALENMFEFNYGFIKNEIVTIINLGASHTNINIMSDEEILFSEILKLGGIETTRKIEKKLEISFEEAESLKTSSNLSDINDTTDLVAPQEVGSIIRLENEEISETIKNSIELFKASHNVIKVDKIFLTGGVAKQAGLLSKISEEVNIPVEIANPFLSIEYDREKFNDEFIENIAPLAGVVVGLGLRC